MSLLTHGHISQVQYRYVVTDLRDNTIIGDLPLQRVSYTNELSREGTLSAEIQVNLDTMVYKLRETTVPGRTGLYVLRNGFPIWGGMIWKRRYSAPSRTLEIEAATFESYLYKRFQRSNRSWAATDQLQIARQITTNEAASILMTVDNKTSGRVRERNMYAHEFKTVGEELEQLGNLIDGFDWNVEITRGDGLTLFRTLRFYYPYRGVSKENTTLSFEYPGSISSVSFSEDAESGANRMWAIGAGEAEEQITRVASDTAGNWPQLHESRSYKSVSQYPTLQAHADSDLRRLRTPVEIAEVDVRADIEPYLGTYNPGDWARFVFKDEYFTPPVTMFMRIVGYTVRVDEEGLETISLVVNTERAELEPGEYEDDE